MTKEEYVKELEKQFGDETLIPETATTTPEAVEAPTEPHKPETEPTATTTDPEGETPSTTTGRPEQKVPEGFETEDAEDGEESSANGEGKRKYSNRHIKKLEWQNRTYSAKIADLEARLAKMENPGSTTEKTAEPPVRRDGESDASFIDRMVAYRLTQMRDAAAEAEAEKTKAEEAKNATLQEYAEKVKKFVPKEYEDWFGNATKENIGYVVELAGGKGSETLNDILGSAKAPVVLAECFKNPALVAALKKMNPVERQMSIWKLGENSTIFVNAKSTETSQKPEVAIVGKVGGGASAITKPMNEMSDDELYAEYLKQGGRV